MNKFKKVKLTLLIIVSVFDLIMLSLGLFLVIYNYDIYTVVFGAILIALAVILAISDFILFKCYKPKEMKINDENPEIKKLTEEIEEIKRKNNIS